MLVLSHHVNYLWGPCGHENLTDKTQAFRVVGIVCVRAPVNLHWKATFAECGAPVGESRARQGPVRGGPRKVTNIEDLHIHETLSPIILN